MSCIFHRHMNMLRKLLTALAAPVKLLLEFPCPGCGANTAENDNRLCPDCRGLLHFVPDDACGMCGGVNDGVLNCCSECLATGKRPWDAAFSVFLYDSAVRGLILKFKYGGRPELAGLFAGFAAAKLARTAADFDCIVPIPVNFLRRLRRGYNQCELLGAELSALTGRPCVTALTRPRGGHQSRRNRAERLAAMKNAFRLRAGTIAPGAAVLLIDDVFTTGATLTAAATELRRANPASITVLTLARRI
ncbi:MAG: phosphoribosyltransferase family protein [Victivallaceae bacterium]|nr:phosphoribosyltransferase family protein [Victivallaceae bacterium]